MEKHNRETLTAPFARKVWATLDEKDEEWGVHLDDIAGAVNARCQLRL
jgi:hypothetical protein